jgi:hypothetical protein
MIPVNPHFGKIIPDFSIPIFKEKKKVCWIWVVELDWQ